MRQKTALSAALAVLVVAGGVAGLGAAQDATTATERATTDTDDSTASGNATFEEQMIDTLEEANLTDDQRAALESEIESMSDDGASDRAIRLVVRGRLLQYGATEAEIRTAFAGLNGGDAGRGGFGHRGRFGSGDGNDTASANFSADGEFNVSDRLAAGLQERFALSDDETETVQEAIEDAQADDATAEELRETVLATLEDLGHDVSDLREQWENGGGRFAGGPGGHRGFGR